jgi:tight adherence protein B
MMIGFPAVQLSLLAAAVLCWPGSGAAHRLCRLPRRRAVLTRRRVRALARVAAPPVVMVAGFVTAGLGGACAATATAVFGTRYWRSRRRMRRRLADATAFARGVRLLVAELRVGAHPVTATEGAADDAPPQLGTFFRDLAGTTRLDGDVTTVMHDHFPTELRAPARRLLRAWALAQRHGVALAELLDAVRRDVEYEAAHLRESEAKMAGPRATAAVLSGLPVLGLILGESVGARPLAVLTATSFGQVLLVLGVGLLCAGFFWTMRLTDAGVRS